MIQIPMQEVMEPEKVELTPQKRDAIHRALLTGLLGNIGAKRETHEFNGARGTKLSIFPGSALFKAKPPWVMAAEIVETTKLYARTCAAVRPEWLERIGKHLLKKSYQDPHWDSHLAQITAFEKVTLFGLTIVERRRVHYGPVDPNLSRQMFIHHALVESDFKTDSPAIQHNRRLVAEIQALEAKARRHDLMEDAQKRFEFFDRILPGDVYSGRTFEIWRKHLEREQPQLLRLTRKDLLRNSVAHLTRDAFPDFLEWNGMKLPLRYRYEPGHPADGITVSVPLEAFNRLSPARVEWLVRGSVEEKMLALMRTLPKAIRTNFIPAPPIAKQAADQLPFAQGALRDEFAKFLGKLSGVPVHRQDFDEGSLPDHLRLNIRVIDESGRNLAVSRDMTELRNKLASHLKHLLAEIPHPDYARDDLTAWDFPDLPAQVSVERGGVTIIGYPTLIDRGNSVSLRLVESKESAERSLREGLKRIFMIQLKQEIKQLERDFPRFESAAIKYALLGPSDDLRAQIISAVVEKALFGDGVVIRTRADFIAREESGWRNLSSAAGHVGRVINETLDEYQIVAQLVNQKAPEALEDSFADLRLQLKNLLPRDFVSKTPFAWLEHLPRYLKAMEVRMKKLKSAGLARDLANLDVVSPYFQKYLDHRSEYSTRSDAIALFEQFRWMVEELRVSLFAQELKTAVPVSPQRLDKLWQQILQQ